jgi:TetR/AcrR family transcriptional regulator, regulator of autoinduction and epiphytic fitness
MTAIKPSRKDRSRNLILDAALIEFEASGVDGAGMEAIATRAGLTRATVYNLFDSKDEIALAIMRRASAQAEPAFRPRLLAGEEALSILKELLLSAADWYFAHPKLSKSVLLSALAGDMETGIPAGRPSFRALVRDILALGQKQGLVRADHEATLLASVILGLFLPAVLYALRAEKPLTAPQIDWLLKLAFEGIGPRNQAK